MQQRESRQAVIVQAHMRGKGAWSDVTIRNISPHGMLLLAARPPRAGDYVEIRKASLSLIGRAVWVNGKAFGVRLVERLNFNALLRAANDSFAASQAHCPHEIEHQPALATARTAEAVESTETATTRAITWIVTAGFLALAVACAAFETLGP